MSEQNVVNSDGWLGLPVGAGRALPHLVWPERAAIKSRCHYYTVTVV